MSGKFSKEENFKQNITHPARIAFICEGDANTNAFSGTAKRIINNLQMLGHTIYPINVRPSMFSRFMIAGKNLSFKRSRWRALFRYGEVAFRTRSKIGNNLFEKIHDNVDIIFQLGATFYPPGKWKVPYVLYCDWNMFLSIKENAMSQSTNWLTLDEAQRINERQREIYFGAKKIFTISERLRNSFINDYQIPADVVVRAYPGPNLELSSLPSRTINQNLDHPPTVLFIGYDFSRKGGDMLLKAFQIVRRRLPDTKLIIIGPKEIGVEIEGVELVGMLNKWIPEEYDRLMHAFLESDVFCFPTRNEPFGIVVLEAMHLGLPCVTSNVWAMPEMVIDGETGFIVSDDDAETYAKRLINILTDNNLRQRMGIAGKQRAEKYFTWAISANIMSQHIQGL